MNYCGENESHCCELIEMPNWKYSYALALYRMSFLIPDEGGGDELNDKATEALKSAILCYPTIPAMLLEKNKINTVLKYSVSKSHLPSAQSHLKIAKKKKKISDFNNIYMSTYIHIIYIYIYI